MTRSMRLYYAREIQDKIDQLKQETNQTWTDMVCAGAKGAELHVEKQFNELEAAATHIRQLINLLEG